MPSYVADDLSVLPFTHEVKAGPYVDPPREKVRDYVVDVIRATRPGGDAPQSVVDLLEHGASPRASIWLLQAAKAHAFLQGRDYVTPHDAKSLAPDVLRHRVAISFEAEAEGLSADDVIQRLLDSVLVP